MQLFTILKTWLKTFEGFSVEKKKPKLHTQKIMLFFKNIFDKMRIYPIKTLKTSHTQKISLPLHT